MEAPANRSASVLMTAVACEWRLLRGDLGYWSALLVLLLCMGYAAQRGIAAVEERRLAVLAADRDEAKRLEALTTQLGKIERGEAKLPDAPYRDPRNAIYVGRGQGVTVASLPDQPLSTVAVGLSDLYPPAFKVSAGSKDSFLFVDEIANPAHLLSGAFDLAFVLGWLYPLVLISVCYNLLSGEREQGTLPLILASSAPLVTVLCGKMLVRAGGLTLGAIAFVLALPLWTSAGLSTEGLLGALAIAGVVAVYGAFWSGVCFWINSWRRDSTFNAVALVMAWVALLLVMPASVNAVAQVAYPAPARSEMILAVRNAAVDAERDRDATEARYQAEHPDNAAPGSRPGLINDERTLHTLRVTLASDLRADAVLAEQEARVRQQRGLSDRLSYLSPPALVIDAITELAGQGHTRWDDYLDRIGTFHKQWQAFFVERARTGQALTAADYAAFPRFERMRATDAVTRRVAARVGAAVGWVGLLAVVVFASSIRRLARVV